MRKIWLFSLYGFCIVAAGGLAGLITMYFLRGEVEENIPPPDFSGSFQFGAASSSYQIEGAWNEEGRSATIWDVMVHEHPELIQGGGNGDEAADSYHLFKEDVKALNATGVNFYRFSISWARILPDGTKTNQAGVDYYNKLINELIANGIEPVVTMYHWDLPQFIQLLGGWTNEVVIDYFDHYADVLFEKFGDRVKKWMTFNEPYEFCHNGYGIGNHAPGVKSPGDGEYLCGHHVLLAHAKAYHNYNNTYKVKQHGEVGICINSHFFYPQNNTTDAALANATIHHMLGWFANPIYTTAGNYPQVMIEKIGNNSVVREGRPWSRLPAFTKEQVNSIKGTSDFFAVNYYTSRIVRPKQTFAEEYGWEDDVGVDLLTDSSWKKGKSDWLFNVPQGLHDLLVWIKEHYNDPKILIAENGFSDGGGLQDDDRIAYIKDHLKAIKSARSEGCRVRAYTVWSIIDNFEWLAGYEEKFGLYSVNFTSPTKERIAKKSSEYFSEVIKTRMIESESEHE